MKIRIDSQTFETPFTVTGEPAELAWLGNRLADRRNEMLVSVSMTIETDAELEQSLAAAERRRQEWVLAEAEKIKQARAKAGFAP